MKRHWKQVLFTGLLLACLDRAPTDPSNPEATREVRVGAALTGEWSSIFSTDVMGIHTHLLPDGTVLSWGADEPMNPVGEVGQNASLWDPWTDTYTPLPNFRTNIFCAGHSFLPDGRLVVAGGHLPGGKGMRDVNVYNFTTRTWSAGGIMKKYRWYPTATTLSNGQILVTSGVDQYKKIVKVPEIGSPAQGWRLLTKIVIGLPLYPWMFAAPNGQVFYAGPGTATAYINPAGFGSVVPVGSSIFGNRSYGSAVMYEPGKVLIVGGGTPPTRTAEVIDLNTGTGWRTVAPMQFARRQMNATLLPDGKVLVTGGTSSTGFNNPAGAIGPAELWDPATETWTTLASITGPRVYHSTALLLPDGRILSAGGTTSASDELTGRHDAEIFSPPYLFQDDGTPVITRPAIFDGPSIIGYGQTFGVTMPDSQVIGQVSLIRLGSVTHAFNQEQRFNRLSFTQAADSSWQQLDVVPPDSILVVQPRENLSITAPATNRLAPPGYYMLFILNDRGVPSVAKIVKLG
jgi:galactose oxidase